MCEKYDAPLMVWFGFSFLRKILWIQRILKLFPSGPLGSVGFDASVFLLVCLFWNILYRLVEGTILSDADPAVVVLQLHPCSLFVFLSARCSRNCPRKTKVKCTCFTAALRLWLKSSKLSVKRLASTSTRKTSEDVCCSSVCSHIFMKTKLDRKSTQGASRKQREQTGSHDVGL